MLHILFWGALWGLFEATAGYLLHLLPANIGWVVWFPAAFIFMERVYNKTGKPYAVLLVALFASSVKLLNLFMPGIRIDRVLNPAISILLEGITVFSVFLIFKNSWDKTAAKAVYAAVIWRGLYLAYLLFVPQWMFDISPLADASRLISFLVMESFINAVTVFTYLKLFKCIEKRSDKVSVYDKLIANKSVPVFILALIILDVAATLLL
ncbi:MAG: hypothetical protein EOM87_01660 [Clostridia bacterium]|nr:hypothetical protein [Clostridia bacterium]